MRLSSPFRGVFWKAGRKVRPRYATPSHAKRDLCHVALASAERGHMRDNSNMPCELSVAISPAVSR